MAATTRWGPQVPVSAAGVGAFLCLLGVCYQAHELGHHFFGGLVCGALGTVSLSTYTGAPGCSRTAAVATELFGPLVSLSIAYGAAAWFRSRPSVPAWGLIFAGYFHLRWIPPLLGGGDELDVVRTLGVGGAVVAVVLFLLGLPPVLVAWAGMARRGRAWRLALAYLLPLPLLLYVDAIAARVSGPDALLPGLARVTVLHVPVTLLLLDAAMVAGSILLARWVRPSRVALVED